MRSKPTSKISVEDARWTAYYGENLRGVSISAGAIQRIDEFLGSEKHFARAHASTPSTSACHIPPDQLAISGCGKFYLEDHEISPVGTNTNSRPSVRP